MRTKGKNIRRIVIYRSFGYDCTGSAQFTTWHLHFLLKGWLKLYTDVNTPLRCSCILWPIFCCWALSSMHPFDLTFEVNVGSWEYLHTNVFSDEQCLQKLLSCSPWHFFLPFYNISHILQLSYFFIFILLVSLIRCWTVLVCKCCLGTQNFRRAALRKTVKELEYLILPQNVTVCQYCQYYLTYSTCTRKRHLLYYYGKETKAQRQNIKKLYYVKIWGTRTWLLQMTSWLSSVTTQGRHAVRLLHFWGYGLNIHSFKSNLIQHDSKVQSDLI